MKYAALVLLLILTVILPVSIESGTLHLTGWDWTAGTSNTYCYIYVPHGDIGCQHAR